MAAFPNDSQRSLICQPLTDDGSPADPSALSPLETSYLIEAVRAGCFWKSVTVLLDYRLVTSTGEIM